MRFSSPQLPRATADRIGEDRNDFWTAFGPTSSSMNLGTGG
jgi:hypothetical protein